MVRFRSMAAEREAFKRELAEEQTYTRLNPYLFRDFYLAFEILLEQEGVDEIPEYKQLYGDIKNFDIFLEAREGEKSLFTRELNLVQYLFQKARDMDRFFNKDKSYKNDNVIEFLAKMKNLRDNTIRKLYSFRDVIMISEEVMDAEVIKVHDYVKKIKEEKDPEERKKLVKDMESLLAIIEKINEEWPVVKKFIKQIKSMKQVMIDKNTEELIDYIKEFDPIAAKGIKAHLERLDDILNKERKYILNLIEEVSDIKGLGRKVKKEFPEITPSS